MKTPLKLTLFLVAANSLMLLLFGASVYYFLYTYSYTDFYKRLETRARISARYNLEANEQKSESFKALREEYLEKLSNEREYLVAVSPDANLDSIARKISLPAEFIRNIFENGRATWQINKTFYAGIRHIETNQSHIAIVSAENYYASNHLIFLRNVVVVGILFIILVTAYLSIYFSKNIFAPIKKITDRVKQISTDNIHLRLEESSSDTEISSLVSTFNDLLNRLETAFETQKNFISNASHEFGTPLTSIIGEAEVMLKKERTAQEYQLALQSILSQAERINQITQSLLMLAQTGYTRNTIKFEIVRMDDLLWQVKEIMDKLNPRHRIEIDFSLLPENHKKLKVNGNRQLLTVALANIMTNACKYSNNKPVYASVASGNEQVIVVVRDLGVGIPASDLPFIYDPFFRASNTKNFDGYGIGLPLTRNIIKIHNGQMQVSSEVNKGTTVQIKLPVARL
jgi:signal transduction histidine kinase